MALSLKCAGSFSSNGEQMFMQDTTGTYNVVSNPGGYGTVNPASTTVTSFQVKCNWVSVGTIITYNFTASAGVITAASVTDGAGTTVNILADLASTAFPIVSPNFLDLTDNFNNSIELPTLADGQFILTYKIAGINNGVAYNYTTSTTFFREVDVCCCLKELRLTADPSCDCNDVQKKVNRIEYWLTNAWCAIDAGKPNETALAYFEKAQAICDGKCGCEDC